LTLVHRHEYGTEAPAIWTEKELALYDRRKRSALDVHRRQKPHIDIAIMTSQRLGGLLA
jgi:hypothetical protein